jgi:beta-lactamase class D
MIFLKILGWKETYHGKSGERTNANEKQTEWQVETNLLAPLPFDFRWWVGFAESHIETGFARLRVNATRNENGPTLIIWPSLCW